MKDTNFCPATDDNTDKTETFYLAIENQIGCSMEIPPDGKFHRFDDPEKSSGNKNCFAMLNEEGTFGMYGNWGAGETYHWRGRTEEPISFGEFVNHHHRLEKTYQDRPDQRAAYQDDAAKEARSLIAKTSEPSPDHPYLKKKSIGVANSRQCGDRLLIPMVNVKGELRNVQQIYPDGTTRFLKGGEVTGNFSLINAECLPSEGELIVCEDWATGVTLQQQHSSPVAVAMTIDNLYEVSTPLRAALAEDVRMTIVVDHERKTPDNRGLALPILAAGEVGAKLIRLNQCSDNPQEH